VERLAWTVGDVVRKLRKRRKLDLETFAHKAGLNKATAGRLERGSASPDSATVAAAAKALGLSVPALYALVPVAVSADLREIVEAFDRLKLEGRAAFRVSILESISEQLKLDEHD